MIINTNLINYIPQCWIYQTTGILCPGCGETRCIVNLFQGNIKEVFFSLVVIGMVVGITEGINNTNYNDECYYHRYDTNLFN